MTGDLGDLPGPEIGKQLSRQLFIRIMPDYGGEYVFDEDGGVFDVTSYFEDHPNVEQIRRIESPLYGWASLLETCAMTNQPIP